MFAAAAAAVARFVAEFVAAKARAARALLEQNAYVSHATQSYYMTKIYLTLITKRHFRKWRRSAAERLNLGLSSRCSDSGATLQTRPEPARQHFPLRPPRLTIRRFPLQPHLLQNLPQHLQSIQQQLGCLAHDPQQMPLTEPQTEPWTELETAKMIASSSSSLSFCDADFGQSTVATAAAQVSRSSDLDGHPVCAHVPGLVPDLVPGLGEDDDVNDACDAADLIRNAQSEQIEEIVTAVKFDFEAS